MIRDKIDKARSELQSTTKAEIDRETAEVWGARAIASFEMYKRTRSLASFAVAVEFEHESLEHAAGGPPGTLEEIQAELSVLKKEALA